MQSYKLTIYSGSETTNIVTGSTLSFDGDYYSYDQSGFNLGVVTEFNVRQYLNNPNNEGVAVDFFTYLTANTSNSEFVEIANSNKKLADSFVEYYSTSVTSGLTTPISIIDNSLTGTSAVTVTNYNYDLSDAGSTSNPLGFPDTIIKGGNRIGTETESLTTYTNEQSFFIPVKIKRSNLDVARINFSEFSGDSTKVINGQNVYLTKGFVDLNKNEDPASFWYDR